MRPDCSANPGEATAPGPAAETAPADGPAFRDGPDWPAFQGAFAPFFGAVVPGVAPSDSAIARRVAGASRS